MRIINREGSKDIAHICVLKFNVNKNRAEYIDLYYYFKNMVILT